jgi:hypothetical protein
MKRKPLQASQPEQDWRPATDEDRRQIADELERVIGHQVFQRSGRYASLLRHVVEKTLQGESSDLKERLIGVDVFHRPSDYDTSEDPVVRFCAGEVRKRLAQYYRDVPDALIEIELPIGSYVPLFRVRATPSEQADTTEQTDTIQSNGTAGQEQANSVVWPAASRTESARFRLISRWPTILGTAAVALIVGLGIAWRVSVHTDPLMMVWGGLLNKGISVQICTGNPPARAGSAADSSGLSIEEHYLRADDRVSIATAAAIANISGFLAANKQPFDLSEAAAISLDNLRNRPLVLVNANNNQWTLFLLQPLRFHFESRNNVGYIVDTDHPTQLSWKVDFDKPYLGQSEDYAIVARFFNKTINAPVLVVAGVGANGTKAAGEFSVSPRYLAELAQGAPLGWEKMNFEAVLKVEIIQGRMGAIQVVSRHFW